MGIPRMIVIVFFAAAAAAGWAVFPSARELGRVHAAAGDPAIAMRWLEVQRSPDPTDRANEFRYLRAADELYLDEQFDLAVRQMERVFGDDPEFIALRIEHAHGRMQRKQIRDLTWRMYFRTGPRDKQKETFYGLSEILSLDGDLLRLEKLYRAELIREPRPDLFGELNSIQKRLGRPFAALKTCRKWEAARPGQPEPLIEQALILEGLGRLGAADKALARASAANPDNRQVIFLYEQLLSRQKQWARADELVARYLKARPEDAEAWAREVQILIRLDRTDEAVRAAQQWNALDPSGIESSLVLAEIWSRAGRSADAEQILMRVHAAGGGSHRTHHLLGDLFFEAGQAAAARKEYQQALGLLRELR